MIYVLISLNILIPICIRPMAALLIYLTLTRTDSRVISCVSLYPFGIHLCSLKWLPLHSIRWILKKKPQNCIHSIIFILCRHYSLCAHLCMHLYMHRDIVRELVSVWNSFVFFEVTPTSFHQVKKIIDTHIFFTLRKFHTHTHTHTHTHARARNRKNTHTHICNNIYTYHKYIARPQTHQWAPPSPRRSCASPPPGNRSAQLPEQANY